MKMMNLGKPLTVITLLSVYFTGFSLISNTTASATTPDLPSQSMLAQNNGICSFITGNSVNVRRGPGTQFPVVTKLNRGDAVMAVRRSGNWVQISGRVTSSPGITPEVVQPLNGWVSNAFINGCSEDQFDRWRQ
jgi:SH3-like domain-containing protein